MTTAPYHIGRSSIKITRPGERVVTFEKGRKDLLLEEEAALKGRQDRKGWGERGGGQRPDICLFIPLPRLSKSCPTPRKVAHPPRTMTTRTTARKETIFLTVPLRAPRLAPSLRRSRMDATSTQLFSYRKMVRFGHERSASSLGCC